MSYTCTSSISSIRDFSQSTLITLRAINSCIALLNIFGNGFLIYALKKTCQTTSLSMQLIVLMSSSDCINGVVALVFTNMLLWKANDSNCTLKAITQFIHILFISISFNTVLLIAIDRYMHIKYLQRYPVIVTKRRGRIILLLLFLFQILMAFCSSMPFLKEYMKIGLLAGLCNAVLGMMAIFVFYYKTIKAVKNRVSSVQNPFMKSTMVQIKALANAAVSISICTALFMTPYVIRVVIRGVNNIYISLDATDLAVFAWFTYLILLANGISSCIIVILQNKPVKRLINGWLVHEPSQ